MLRSRFFWKLYATYIVLIALTVFIVRFFISHQMESDSLAQIRQTLKSKAELLRSVAYDEFLEPSDRLSEELQDQVEVLREDGTRVTLILVGGGVLADSHEDPEEMDDHSKREEILKARKEGEGISTRFSHTLDTNMMYYAIPLEIEGEIRGFVRTALPLFDIEERQAHLKALIALGAFIAAAVALLPGFFLARQVSRPLALITKAAERIAHGESGEKLWRGGSDEVSNLARAFDSMSIQLKEKMDSLLSESNKLQAILNSVAEGVIAIDCDERVVHINTEAARILGCTIASSLGKPMWEITRLREVCIALTETLKTGADIKDEVKIVGQPVDSIIEFHTTTLRDADNQPSGATAVLYDATQIRSLSTVRRDFVTNVSHELKTPLTAIRGLAETIIDDSGMDGEQRGRFLRKILKQTDQLSKLVSDLLDLSKIETGAQNAVGEPLNVCEAVHKSVEDFRPEAQARGLELIEEMSESPAVVRIERQDFDRMIGNLIDNAIKYTPSEGKVWVRIRIEGRNVVVEIQDTGVGIEPMEHNRVFERFYRVDKARSRELGGTGLGLSIAKNVAEAYGGKIMLDSLPGRGSTFMIFLPVYVEPANSSF